MVAFIPHNNDYTYFYEKTYIACDFINYSMDTIFHMDSFVWLFFKQKLDIQCSY